MALIVNITTAFQNRVKIKLCLDGIPFLKVFRRILSQIEEYSIIML